VYRLGWGLCSIWCHTPVLCPPNSHERHVLHEFIYCRYAFNYT
jgi:hypothetical protein